MQSFFRLVVLSFFPGVVACSQTTGGLPAGPDTYTVTEHRAPILGAAAEAQRVAMTEANDYCDQQGKKFFPLKYWRTAFRSSRWAGLLCHLPLSTTA